MKRRFFRTSDRVAGQDRQAQKRPPRGDLNKAQSTNRLWNQSVVAPLQNDDNTSKNNRHFVGKCVEPTRNLSISRFLLASQTEIRRQGVIRHVPRSHFQPEVRNFVRFFDLEHLQKPSLESTTVAVGTVTGSRNPNNARRVQPGLQSQYGGPCREGLGLAGFSSRNRFATPARPAALPCRDGKVRLL